MTREVHHGSGDQSKTVIQPNSDMLSHNGIRETTFDDHGKQTSETHHTPDGKSHSHVSSGAIKK